MEILSALVESAQGGDLEAFEKIVGLFQNMAYTSAYSMLNDAQVAEDVTQETFIEAYLELSKLREPATFPGWFRRIVFKQSDRLTRGLYDDLPEQAFYFVGGIDAAVAKSHTNLL